MSPHHLGRGENPLKTDRLARKGILKIASYIPGRSIEEVQKEYGAKRWVKLASNENLLGPSPKALEAIRRELPNIHFYPEGPSPVLRQALAKTFSLAEGNIVISNGADNLILMIANAFVDEGDEVIMADPTFPVYTNVTQIMGGKPIRVRLQDYTHDLDGMLNRVTRKTKLIFVCNPNNPTGTIVSESSFNQFLSRLPGRVIVILDEAYGDFAEAPFYPNGLDYVKDGKQVIALRTFSKVYGLAGLRIGYAIGREDLIHCLYQVRDPFPVHRLAQVAAVAALADTDHILKSIQLVYEGRRYLYKELEKMGILYVPSEANFIFIDFEKDVEEVFQGLLREGIIIRPGKTWGYPTCSRITIGRMTDNRRFIRALKKILTNR
ncbi:MAG: histidinol-phosphate transaminase [Deltaproteobacteria bacterium RBG_16_49_23]|nr:MAG: histidinol-phosphate transaminase [Deltaproteobacteria bacterium RBG_16_49_23]